MLCTVGLPKSKGGGGDRHQHHIPRGGKEVGTRLLAVVVIMVMVIMVSLDGVRDLGRCFEALGIQSAVDFGFEVVIRAQSAGYGFHPRFVRCDDLPRHSFGQW